jgi:SAM-dependent methyltransferase
MRLQALQDQYNRWHHERLGQDDRLGLDPREERFYAWLFGLLEAESGDRLLDVACGQGRFLGYADSHGLDVTGVDVSPVAVDAARARVPDAKVLVADGETLPFDAASFDRVACIGSLEHFPDPAAGAAEIARILRPDGQAVVFVPNLFFLGHVWFGVWRGTQPSEGGQVFSEVFLSSEGWANLLSDAGLEVRRFHVWNHIFASDRVRPVVMRAWNALSRFLPRNAAYAFAFVCTIGLQRTEANGSNLSGSAPSA